MRTKTTNWLFAAFVLVLGFARAGRTDPLDRWTWRSGRSVHDVTFGADQFVAVGEQGLVMTSSDALNWIQRSAVTTGDLSSVTYGKAVFVAVGTDFLGTTSTIVTSNDGINWVRQQWTNSVVAVA